jgi:hypothetical protein
LRNFLEFKKNIDPHTVHVAYADHTTPDGYFAGLASVSRKTRTYLFKGELNDDTAEPVGYIVVEENFETFAYKGNYAKGWESLGPVTIYEETFALMIGK